MSAPKPPCKDCTDRYLACHDKCEKFAKFKEDSWKFKQQLFEIKGGLATSYFRMRMKESAYTKDKRWKERVFNKQKNGYFNSERCEKAVKKEI